ncbi:MAG: hypothetical protein CXX71_02220, partial [Methanobacteriota archaeon]
MAARRLEYPLRRLSMSDIPTKTRHRLAVYAIGGNALSDPALVGGEASAAAAAAMDAVLSDVVDLLEAGT